MIALALLALGLGLFMAEARSGCGTSRAINATPEWLSGILKPVGDALDVWDEDCVAQPSPNPPFPPPDPDDTQYPPVPGTPPPGTPPLPQRPWRTIEEGAVFYRPRLYFDGGEQWRPVRVDSLIRERREHGGALHRICGFRMGAKKCARLPSIDQVDAVADRLDRQGVENLALDIEGRRPRDYRATDSSCWVRPREATVVLNDCASGPASAIYYHHAALHSVFGGTLHVFDYWWFLRYNDVRPPSGCTFAKRACVDHEGDWEGVRVVVADSGAVFSVDFAQHEWPPFRYIAPELAQLQHRFAPAHAAGLVGERVAVYVAAGTHASYPFPCASNCIQARRRSIAGANVVFPEGNHGGVVAWPANRDDICRRSSCLVELPESSDGSWLTADIGWGWREKRQGSGPKSVVEQPRYQESVRLARDGFPLAADPPTLGQPSVPGTPGP